MIKSFLWVFVAVACCVCYFMGLSSGLQARLILADRQPVVAPERRELKCTCVPCLPDLYCFKCGHKSRDCPKLRDYFSKHGGAGGVVSSNAVQSVKIIAPGA